MRVDFVLIVAVFYKTTDACGPAADNGKRPWPEPTSPKDSQKYEEKISIPSEGRPISELERFKKEDLERPPLINPGAELSDEDAASEISAKRRKRRRDYDDEDEDSPVVRKSRRLCKKLVPAIVCNYVISDNVFIWILDTLLMFF
ncbi:unnamed protein product, partial [Mesorhabditis spiculigera]